MKHPVAALRASSDPGKNTGVGALLRRTNRCTLKMAPPSPVSRRNGAVISVTGSVPQLNMRYVRETRSVMENISRQCFITPDGLSLVGDMEGPVEGPTVILLHGGGQTRHSWAGAMRSLAKRGYLVISYDARGHGESDWSPTGDYSMQALAADLRAVLSTADLHPEFWTV